MPAIIQSLKTKFELVAVCLALLGVAAGGVYGWAIQSKTLDGHTLDLVKLEAQQEASKLIAQALRYDIDAKLLPSILRNQEEIVRHHTRLETMEKNARSDREILLEIRNDLKWMRAQADPLQK
jgi:hypothetical protein